MSITETFLGYALADFLWLLIGFGFGWVFGRLARPDDHDEDDDAEQAEYLRAANAESENRRRVKAYPLKEVTK